MLITESACFISHSDNLFEHPAERILKWDHRKEEAPNCLGRTIMMGHTAAEESELQNYYFNP
jgi:hypothetical protein